MRLPSTDRGAIDRLKNHFVSLPVPSARVFRNAVAIIGSVAWPPTYITFTGERWDIGNLWIIGTPTRLTCHTGGKYQISWSIEWAANAAGRRTAIIMLNGATLINADSRPNLGAADVVAMSGTTVWDMAVNDFVELGVIQTSGGNLNVLSVASYTAEFMMVRVG